MSISVACPSCQSKLKVKSSHAGQTLRCPACKGSIKVPALELPAAPHAAGNSATPELTGMLGRFSIRNVLGQGAFGTVYRAWDPILDREVALKTPRRGGADASHAEQLVAEAKSAARLRHPHIVAVYEAGAAGDDLYVAAEYVSGTTLADRMQGEPIAPETAVRWTKQLAEALAYAHGSGIIHRDVKPHNVMLDAQDRPQLMDFGLARRDDAPAGEASESAGTPAYMSPEQARGSGEEVGPASDQYGLGIVLYELLAGTTPWSGTSAEILETLRDEKSRLPELRAGRPKISPDLAAVCEKALARRPADRYADCQAFADDLQRWLDGELVLARRHSAFEHVAHWARRHPAVFGWLTAAASLLLLLTTGSVIYGVTARAASPVSDAARTTEVGKQTNNAPEESPPTGTSSPVGRDELMLYGRLLDRSHDNFRLRQMDAADHWLEQARWDLRNWEHAYLRKIITGGWKTLYGHTAEVVAVACHPDGTQIASAALDGTIRIWDPTTGEKIQRIVDPTGTDITALAYSPDGERLAVAHGKADIVRHRDAAPADPRRPWPPVLGLEPRYDDELGTTIDPARKLSPEPVPETMPNQPAGNPPAGDSAEPPGRFLVTLYGTRSWQPLGDYADHPGPIQTVSFSADGEWVMSGGEAPGQIGAPPPQFQPGLPIPAPAPQPADAPPPPPTASAPRSPLTTLLLAALAQPAPPAAAPAPPPPPGENPQPMPHAPAPPRPAGVIHLWNAETLETVRTFSTPSGSVRQAVFGHELKSQGPFLVANPSMPQEKPFISTIAALAGGRIHVWNQDDGQLIHNLNGNHAYGRLALPMQSGMGMHHYSVAPQADLQRLFGIRRSGGGLIGLIEHGGWHDDKPQSTAYGAPAAVRTLNYAPGQPSSNAGGVSSPLAAGGGDPLQAELPGHAIIGDGGLQASPQLWGHRGSVLCSAFREDGRVLVTGGADGLVKIWQADLDPERRTLGPHRSLTDVAFSPDGRLVAMTDRAQSRTPGGGAACYAPGVPMPVQPMPAQPVISEATPSAMSRVIAHDAKTGRRMWELTAGPGDLVSLVFDPQQCWLAAAGGDPQIWRWDLSNNRLLEPLITDAPVQCLAVTRDGRQLAAGLALPAVDGQPQRSEIRRWELPDGKELLALRGHAGPVTSVAFSPEGTQLASSGRDRKVLLWSLDNPAEPRELAAHPREFVRLAFRPDGRDIAGASCDPCRPDQPGDLVVWSVDTGEKRFAVTGHAAAAQGLAYSPDGKRLVSSGGAAGGSVGRPGEVKLWDAETGIEVLTLAGQSGRDQKTEMMAYEYITTHEVVEKAIRPVTKMVIEKREKVVDGKAVEFDVEVPITVEEVYEVKKPVQISKTAMRQHPVLWEAPGAVAAVAFSADGSRLAAACENGAGLVWDAGCCDPHHTSRWPSGRIECVAVNSDGTLIATGGTPQDKCESPCTGVIRLYDAQTGRIRLTIATTAGAVRSLAFAPEGTRLVSAAGCDGAGAAEVWDVATGDRVAEFRDHAGPVTSVAVTPDGRYALTGGHDRAVRLWELETGVAVRAWTKLDQPVDAVAIDRDGNSWAAALSDPLDAHSGSTLLLAELASDSNPQSFPAVDGRLAALAFHPTEAILAAAGQHIDEDSGRAAARLWQWDAANPQTKPKVIAGTSEGFTSVRFSPDGSRLGTGSFDWSAEIWTRDGERKFHFTGHLLPICGVDFLPDGRFVSASHDRQIKTWELPGTGKRPPGCGAEEFPRRRTLALEPNHFLGFACMPMPLAVSADRKTAAMVETVMQQLPQQHPVRRIDLATNQTQACPGHADVVRSIVMRKDGSQIASASQDRQVILWSSDGCEQQRRLPHPSKVMKVAYSADGRLLASAVAFSGKVLIWNSETGELVRTLQADATTSFAIAFNRDGSQLATGGIEGIIRIWNVETGELVREQAGHEGQINSLRYSPDGTSLASAGSDRLVRLWNAESAEPSHEFPGFETETWDCAFSPDGKFLAGGGWEPVVRIWNLETKALVKELPNHGRGVWSLEFSPDGRQLATCGREQPLFVWNWEQGTHALVNYEAGECLTWLPDGGGLLTGSTIHAPQPTKFTTHVKLYDLATQALKQTIDIEGLRADALSLNVDGSRFVVYGAKDAQYSAGRTLIYDAARNEMLAELQGHGERNQIRAAAVHPDGESVITAGQDGTVRIWSLDGTELRKFAHPGIVTTLAVDPNGTLLATGGEDRLVRLWSLDFDQPPRELTRCRGFVASLAFSPDGLQLAAASMNWSTGLPTSHVKLWDVASGKPMLSLGLATGRVGLAFHPTQAVIALPGAENSVELRDLSTGRVIQGLPSAQCTPFAFTADGERLLCDFGKLIDARIDPAFPVQPLPQPDEEPQQSPADEAAARWVLEHGGQVQILSDGRYADIARIEQLPTEPYALARIVLTNREDVRDADLEILRPLKKLQAARLDLRTLTDDGLSVLGELTTLEELYLNATQLTDDGLRSFAKLTRLRVLHANDTPLTGAGFASLTGLAQLASIELHRAKIDDAGAPSLARLPSLASLAMHNVPATDAGLKALGKSPKLRSLSLAGTKIAGTFLRDFSGKQLDGLSLYDTLFDDEGLAALKEVSVAGASVARTKITDAGLEHLRGFRGRQLILDANAITDAGLQKYLAAKPPLTQLSIAHIPLTDAVIDSLAGIPTLTSLSLPGTKITDEGVARLKAVLPQCQVHR